MAADPASSPPEQGGPRLRAEFTRTGEARDHVEVTLPDATKLTWQVRATREHPPRDLVQLLVESALGLSHGFWGLLLRGTDVLSRRSSGSSRSWPTLDQQSFTTLAQAEAVISAIDAVRDTDGVPDPRALTRTIPAACARMGVPAPGGIDEARCEDALAQVAAAERRWRALKVGQGLRFSYP